MLTIYEIVIDFLQKKRFLTFDQIFTKVETKLKKTWQKRFPNLDYQEIKIKKIGEVYTMLTIYGDFIKQNDDHWTLRSNLSYQEIQNAKIRISQDFD